MNSSLYTAVLGLQNHQTRMDVIGNNIANVNTYGFKRGRATFADILSRTYTGAAAPRNGRGGINPLQVGMGMVTKSVTNIMNQGQMESTGRLTDVAIDGSGWFVLKAGNGTNVYTRDGAFGLDREGTLVNADGAKVQGWSTVNVTNDHTFTVDTQRPVDSIDFKLGDKMEAAATSQVGLKSNLKSDSRSLIADGIDPKEGWAKKTDKLVDLYSNNAVDPEHLGMREGDWVEVHAKVDYQERVTYGTTVTLPAVTSWGATSSISAVPAGSLPIDISRVGTGLPGGYNRVYALNPAAASAATDYMLDESTGQIFMNTPSKTQVLGGTGLQTIFTLTPDAPYNTGLPVGNISIPGYTQVAAAPGAGQFSYSAGPNTITFGTAPVAGQVLNVTYNQNNAFPGLAFAYDILGSDKSTMPLGFGNPNSAEKYLYFQITNDTNIGNLESMIQNALDAVDTHGTLGGKAQFDEDNGVFHIFNNAVAGSRDFNSIKVDINAVSGSAIREGFLLKDSTYPSLTGTKLGIVDSALGEGIGTTREVIGAIDYQNRSTGLDYKNVDSSTILYAKPLTARWTNTMSVPQNAAGQLTVADFAGYRYNGLAVNPANVLKPIDSTVQLTVDGTAWRRVNYFSGAANEYVLTKDTVAAGGGPVIKFNLAGGFAPAAGSSVILNFTPSNAVDQKLNLNADYTIDQSTGNISLNWANGGAATTSPTASSQLGTGANTQFTGTVVLSAVYTTEDRREAPPATIMDNRWADFNQEIAPTTSGGSGKGRVAFNNMFAAINASATSTTPGTVYDQATSTQPTDKDSSLLQSAATHRTSIDVYDSLGEAHTLQFIFTHVGSNFDTTKSTLYQNRWAWRAELPYSDTFSFDSMDTNNPATMDATARNAGQFEFDSNGLIVQTKLGGMTGPIMFDPSPIGSNGSSTMSVDRMSININVNGHDDPIKGITQYASDFTTSAYEQNGWAMGILDTFSVDQTGIINGSYTNNVVKPIAQLALAMFPNQEGLMKLGNNTFGLSANSGLANVVPAYVAGGGSIVGGSLEQSNVDIVTEFTTMITTERGFQANSRMVTTSDEMLTEVINMKR